MKKLTLLAIVFAMCLSVSGCGKEDKDTTATGSDVSSIPLFVPDTETMGEVEYPSEEELGIIHDENGVVYKAEYDTLGRMIRRTCIDGDSGMYGMKNEYKYTVSGLLESDEEYDIYGVFSHRTVYAYYEDGAKKSVTVSGRFDKLLTYTEYDTSGRVLKNVKYGSGEAVEAMEEYTYSADGKLLCEKTTFVSVGIFEEKQYDMSGNKIKYIKYDADGAVLSVTDYVYAEAQLMEEKTSGADGAPTESYKYEYDEQGRTHRRLRYNGQGVIQDQEVCYYDAEGNLESVIKYDPNGYEI